MLDMLRALQMRGQNQEAELPEEDMGEDEEDDGTEPQLDPRGMSADGETLFIAKDKFPDNCKIGDDIKISATVTKHGSKYGVVVNEIAKANSGFGEEETAE